MTKTELLALIAGQENSKVEFKRDDCRPEQLAKEMSALMNLNGGVVLLGVDDDGHVSGLTRGIKETEEWLMNIARNNLQPATIPVWTAIPLNDDSWVGIVELVPDSPSKPYKALRGGAWITYMRIGSTSREATREEEARLYQAAGIVRYELKRVPDTGFDSLEIDRVKSYFRYILDRSAPERNDIDSWRNLLINSDILVGNEIDVNASVAGLLLFGTNVNRRLPQAGVTAVAYPGLKKDYTTVEEERIRGPLSMLVTQSGELVETGVIDRTVDFVKRNMGNAAWLDGARRINKPSYPIEAIREAVVNAVVHRDYSREGTDIEVSLYVDRLEVISPGKLPNGVTIAKMREGVVRVARNELLKEILRDYGYIEHFGMGVRTRIIESMKNHNGTNPDLEEHDDRFVVRLWKKRQ